MLKHEFSPWRSEYFGSVRCKCPFCEIANKRLINSPEGEFATADEGNFVLFRRENFFCVMNRYPYTLGEFMLIPNAHEEHLERLPLGVWQEMSALFPLCVSVLKEALGAKGVNVGINLGSAAGAGIGEHLHVHFVPRWSGDTNFMMTTAYTRVHGVPFFAQYQKLKEAFGKKIKGTSKKPFNGS